MKGHNQNKYLQNYIKLSMLTHTEWTEYRINLGRKNLVCDPGFATESLNLPMGQCLCLPGGIVLGGHSLMGNAASGPGVVIPGLTGCYGLFTPATATDLTQDPAGNAKFAWRFPVSLCWVTV